MIPFVEFVASHGLLIDEPVADGCIHRVPTDDDKPGCRSGWYRFTGKYGCCGNWKLGGEAEHWHADGDKGMPVDSTEREIESRRRLLEQAKKQGKKVKERRHREESKWKKAEEGNQSKESKGNKAKWYDSNSKS